MLQTTRTLHTCQPWCTNHINGTPANRWPQVEDQICRKVVESPVFGEFAVSNTIADDSPMVTLYGIGEELTLAEAEQLAYMLLAQVASARTAVAA